jgi:hypothetical protein
MHRSLASAFLVGLVGTLALMASGCAPQKYSVSGKVLYNGAVLNKPDGIVIFMGPQGEQLSTPINQDGTYQVLGVSSGVNKIAVYYLNPKTADSRKKRTKGPPKDGEVVDNFLTPEKYSLPESSGLTLDVNKEMTYNIELSGPPIP